MLRKVVAVLLLFGLIFSTLSLHAEGDKNTYQHSEAYRKAFSDVPEGHWAYDYVTLMSQLGIISGYEDGTFRPEASVSRAEFAKMMVLTLGLDLYNPGTPTFSDVGKSDWEYKYVETAKPYLTGWSSGNGYLFRSDTAAVREDLAVAIVKGLKLDAASADLGSLNDFADSGAISSNLRSYVAKAYQEGIMIGNSTGFNPQKNISRAEAATLLARLIIEEKVVFDETKVVFEDDCEDCENGVPYLEYQVLDSKVLLKWTNTKNENFKYYKVVLSLDDSTPSYPDNGYLAVTEDQSYYVKAGQTYNGMSVKAGETYYAAITAVYNDEKITSNVISITIPGQLSTVTTAEMTPVLSAQRIEEGVKLTWTDTTDEGLNYYKVVMSKSDSTPRYPDNGWLVYHTNLFELVTPGRDYSSGDFSEVESGETYYFSVTAVYNNGKYTSNVIQMEMP